MPIKIIKLILSIGFCLSAGILGSFFTVSSIPTWYATLIKPSFSPPNWIFGPVWTTLYILMGISLYLVWKKKKVPVIFWIQLILNAVWSMIFFGMRNPAFALVDIAVLWITIFLTITANEPTGSSPSERLLETVLAGFAQHDNDVRSERTKNGLRARFLAGKVTNRVPFGYINEKGYALKDEKTWDIYKRAWDLMATGTKSLRDMQSTLKVWGISISIQKTQHMFRNKFYMGILTSRSYPEQVKGQHIPMVSEELFYKVQAILDGRNPNKTVLPVRNRDKKEFPLRRIVRCGRCNTPFTAAWSKGRNGRYGYYFCRKRCTGQSVSIGTIDESMKALLKEVSPTEQGLKLFIKAFLNTFQKRLREVNKRQQNAEDEIAKLKALRQTLVEKNLAGTFSDEIFKEQNAVIEEKLSSAYSSNDNELINQFNIEAGIAFIEKKLKDLSVTYEDSVERLPALRSLLGSIFLSGFTWQYPGYSKLEFSPLYQAIKQFEDPAVSISWV